ERRHVTLPQRALRLLDRLEACRGLLPDPGDGFELHRVVTPPPGRKTIRAAHERRAFGARSPIEPMSVREKAVAAREDLADCDGVLVAFSGGVDSSVVAALAHDALGDDAVACTAKSETLPDAELGGATEVA